MKYNYFKDILEEKKERKNKNKIIAIRKEMANYLGHNRNYVLLFIVVIIIIFLVLWALFRNKDDCKDGDCRDSYSKSDSRSRSKSKSKDCDKDSRYNEDSRRNSDKYSSDSYSESSYSHSKNRKK